MITITRERLYLAVLWFIAIVALSVPWADVNGEWLTGWGLLTPFGFPYLIGLVWGLVVLITKARPAILSLIAGSLMITGVNGGIIGVSGMKLAAALGGGGVEYIAGIYFAFIWSVVYTIVAPILGKRIAEKNKHMAEKYKQMAEKYKQIAMKYKRMAEK